MGGKNNVYFLFLQWAIIPQASSMDDYVQMMILLSSDIGDVNPMEMFMA